MNTETLIRGIVGGFLGGAFGITLAKIIEIFIKAIHLKNPSRLAKASLKPWLDLGGDAILVSCLKNDLFITNTSDDFEVVNMLSQAYSKSKTFRNLIDQSIKKAEVQEKK